jgi:hypothetical protein
MYQHRANREKRGATRKNETIEQKAARLTAEATRWIAIFTVVMAIVAGLTLWNLIAGGADTKALVEASKQQAIAARQFAATAGLINGNINDAVGKLDRQAAATETSSNAAKSVAGTASRQLEATDRPWIKIIGAVANHPVIYHTAAGITTHGNDFVNLGIKVIVQNVGKSAALDVVTRADVIFVSMSNGAPNNPFTYPVTMQKALCSKPANVGLPINLFPGEDNREQSGDDHDIPTSGKTFTIPQDPDRLPRLMPYFVGCVDYKIGVSGKVHQSGFIYSVEQAIPGYANRGLLILGSDIAITDIRMERFAFGGFDAN